MKEQLKFMENLKDEVNFYTDKFLKLVEIGVVDKDLNHKQ